MSTDPNDIDAKYRQDILNDFEDMGIQLSKDQQARLKIILDNLTKIEQEFARNIRDNPEKVEFSADELRGLPNSYIANLKKNEQGQYLLGFDYPEYLPFMQLADSDDARKRYQIAYTRRGTEKNLVLLKQAIDLRYELAQLFGYKSYADWKLKNRMAQNPETVNHFLNEVHTIVAPLEKKEVQTLREFKAKTLKIPVEKAGIHRWSEG